MSTLALVALISGSHSVMINFDHFCLEFNPDETEEGGFYDMITIDDEEFEIDFTPELLEAATVDSDGTWTIGDMTLEFFELKKVKQDDKLTKAIDVFMDLKDHHLVISDITSDEEDELLDYLANYLK